MNKEKNLIDQRASLRVDTRETQQINWRRRHWDFPYRNTSYRRSYPIRSFFASIVSTMAETTELIKLLADQIQVQRQQMEQQAKQMEQQAQFMEQQSQQHREEMDQQAQQRQNLLKILDVQKHGTGENDSSAHHPQLSTVAIPPFAAFDSTSELWPDYWSRFCTFVVANAVPEQRQGQVFLTNQTAAVYKQLANLATQQTPPRDINKLTMSEIVNFMKEQFDPKLFIVRERFKFWSDMQRKPGETLQELAACIRQDAATCDFPSIEDPEHEALRLRFICSVNNEAVLKAVFKVKDTDLTFARAVQVAIETEDAARVAKETFYSSKARPVNKVHQKQKKGPQQNHQQSHSKDQQKCYRCGKVHKASDCPYKEAKCHFCDKKGHLKAVCQKKQRQEQERSSHNPVKRITKAELVKAILGEVSQDTPRLDVPDTIQDRQFTMGLDTATTGNFVSLPVWKQLGKPKLDDVRHRYESASKHDLPVLGTFMAETKHPVTGKQSSIPYIVTKIPDLNLLGRNAIQTLGIFVNNALGLRSIESQAKRKGVEAGHPAASDKSYVSLQRDCQKLCDEFPDLFKPELGCLKDFELEVKFKADAVPVFLQGTTGPICSS